MKKLLFLILITSSSIYGLNWSPESHPGNKCEAEGGIWAWDKTANSFGCLLINASKELQLSLVNQNPNMIQYIINPDTEIQLLAIKKDPNAIGYLRNLDREIQLAIIQKDPRDIYLIKNPIKEIDILKNGVNNRPMLYKTSDKILELSIENSNELKITNKTGNFIKINSLAEYFGKDIRSYESFSIPPQGVYTKSLLPLNTVKVNSLNDTIIYGFAIEYTLPNNNKQFSIFKTNKYKLSDF